MIHSKSVDSTYIIACSLCCACAVVCACSIAHVGASVKRSCRGCPHNLHKIVVDRWRANVVQYPCKKDREKEVLQMATVNFKVSVPQISKSQQFNLEVEVNSKGELSISLPQQTVKATGCYLPFAEILDRKPVRSVMAHFENANTENGKHLTVAKTPTGRELQVYFSPREMRDAIALALTADYC